MRVGQANHAGGKARLAVSGEVERAGDGALQRKQVLMILVVAGTMGNLPISLSVPFKFYPAPPVTNMLHLPVVPMSPIIKSGQRNKDKKKTFYRN